MSSVQLNRPLAFLVSRWIFLRLLGLIYLIAFMSLAVQVTGLVGAEGILPVGPYLDRLQETYGTQAYRLFPTLLWLSSKDLALMGLCWFGSAIATLLLAGIAPVPLLVLLWVSYLSLAVAADGAPTRRSSGRNHTSRRSHVNRRTTSAPPTGVL